MKILYFFVVFLSFTFAVKEKPLTLDQILSDRKLWLQLEKRLGIDADKPTENSGSRDHDDDDVQTGGHPDLPVLQDSVGDECHYRKNESTLIKTNLSLRAGAFFLKSFSGTSGEECLSRCCYTQGCNLAVYENKENNNCYLFNCGRPSKCSFASHGEYEAYTFPPDTHPPKSQVPPQKQHEDELQDLGSQAPETPVPEVPVTTPPKPKKPVVLYQYCNWNDVCEDPNAGCRGHRCACAGGYHAKYGVCRQICNSDQFECDNRDQDQTVPDCIGNSFVCDGTEQCADGSDEYSCPSKGPPTYNKPPVKNSNTEDSKNPIKPVENDVSKQESSDVPPKVLGPDVVDYDQPSSEKKDHGIIESPEVPPQQSDSKGSAGSSDMIDDTFTTDEVPTSEEGNDNGDKVDDNGDKVDVSGEKVDVSGEKIEDKPVNKTANSDLQETKEVPDKSVGINEEERVVVASFTDSSQGPIVALSLGLAITLMLLVFVGCRLRTVKRRIRKGRVLHSNEADYLINGMYL